MKELKKVTSMLGTMLTKEEVEEFMKEADLVRYSRNGFLILMLFSRMGMES